MVEIVVIFLAVTLLYVAPSIPWDRLPGTNRPRLGPPPTTDHQEVLLRVARSLGLEIDGATISGGLDGAFVTVVVDSARASDGIEKFSIDIEIETYRTLPVGVAFLPRRGEKNRRAFTGDPKFDDEYVVLGDRALLHAMLGASARDMVLGVGGRFDFSGTALRWRGARAPTFLERMIRQLVAFAMSIAADPLDVHVSLAQHTRNDPLPTVRERCLLALVREHPRPKNARRTLIAALDDVSPQVRIRAAVALGERGYPTLIALVTGPNTDDETRMTAALRLPVGEPDAVRGLVRLTQRDDRDIRCSAIRSLGFIGTVEEVGALKPLASGLLGDPVVRAVAKQALDRIKSRARGAAPGQLSIAGATDSGALSVADEHEGALSEPWD